MEKSPSSEKEDGSRMMNEWFSASDYLKTEEGKLRVESIYKVILPQIRDNYDE